MSFLFLLSFRGDTLVGVETVLFFFINIMYEYDSELIRFHAVCSSLFGVGLCSYAMDQFSKFSPNDYFL